MRIKMTCPCGAMFDVDNDDWLFPNGDLDEKGRKFALQVTADLWINTHSYCLALPITPSSGTGT